MIAHLQGREQALERFGWTGRRAEWIALACLHSGVFTRAQWTRFLGCHTEKVRRAVHALIAQGVATEENVPGIQRIGRMCRIFSRRIYRALGAEDIRHRRTASETVLMRHLLSLDYVLQHPDLPWLPTEPEKVGAFEELGIERRLLPSRLYRGAAGNTRRYFPLKLPVALDSGRAVFVYVDPGHETATALRSWGAAHRGPWHALQGQGQSVDVLEEFGGLQAAMKRSVTLEKQVHRQPAPGFIRRAALGGRCVSRVCATDDRRATQGRTGLRKRHGGRMRTLALRRCARVLRRKPRHGHVLRLRVPTGRGRTGRSAGDGSDPPVRGPGTGSDAGVFSHPAAAPSGSLPYQQSLAGRLSCAAVRRRMEIRRRVWASS